MLMKKHIWEQIKGIPCDEIIRALKKDGYDETGKRGAEMGFRHNVTKNYVVIHYHPDKTYGPNLLKALIKDIGWTPKDMKRLKLIK